MPAKQDETPHEQSQTADQLAAMQRAPGEQDEAEKQQERMASKHYTVLGAVNRNGRMLYPGDKIEFEDHEGPHVQQLLADGTIMEGAPNSKEVKERLRQITERDEQLRRQA